LIKYFYRFSLMMKMLKLRI